MIYYVEDESNIRDLVVYTLKASGFEAQGFEDSGDFWSAMKAQKPHKIRASERKPWSYWSDSNRRPAHYETVLELFVKRYLAIYSYFFYTHWCSILRLALSFTTAFHS
ncbi:MAG: hypothetical protein K6G89_00015 [Clostridia bacterium]|nr:hypothetical protein [Clostridia bacterium]